MQSYLRMATRSRLRYSTYSLQASRRWNSNATSSSSSHLQSKPQSQPHGTSNGGSPPKPNPHREFYYTFGSPIITVFLGAYFTYELLYWSWLKLESIELKKEKEAEIQALEQELAQLHKKSRP